MIMLYGFCSYDNRNIFFSLKYWKHYNISLFHLIVDSHLYVWCVFVIIIDWLIVRSLNKSQHKIFDDSRIKNTLFKITEYP